MKDAILRVRNLTTDIMIGKKIYSVVENLSFDLFLGKTLAIVGESGCGKTLAALSLLKILPMPPFFSPKGSVHYRDTDLLHLSEKRLRKIRGKKISMIFQDPNSALNPVYTVGYQLMEVVEHHLGLYDEEAHVRVLESLCDVGITNPEERMQAYPHQLSGGMKQRVMIAMALICEPDILIADEPTTALDVTIQAQVLQLIRRLQKKRGTALLLITHDMGVVAEMADDVMVMYASQNIENGDVETVFDSMGHPYTQGLFLSRPLSQLRKKRLIPISGSVPPMDQYPSGCRFHPRCPYAMEKCRKGTVPNFTLDDGHSALCWLHDGTEESMKKLEKQWKKNNPY